ncbi:MAG: hypothetical protein K2X86_16630 [Cytophagaceae bacterium]|nr:hypothetical protein [Cytophagaceae bacterium]
MGWTRVVWNLALATNIYLFTFSISFSSDIPSFTFKTLDSIPFATYQLADKNLPLLVVHVDPGCTYSQDQTYLIKQNINTFENVLIVFVVSSEFSKAKLFAENYDLTKLKNVLVLVDENDSLKKWSGAEEYGIPAVFVYDNAYTKVESFRGLTSLEDLKSTLNKISLQSAE